MIDGTKATGASFWSIGTNGVFLTDITFINLPSVSKGVMRIETLDKDGKSVDTYAYYRGGTLKYKTEGWYQGSTLIQKGVNDVFFKNGDGLWFTGTAGVSFNTSGQVIEQPVECDLIDGNRMLSNPFPCATTLTKIKLVDLPSVSKGVIRIETLDKDGKSVDTYAYYRGGR